MRIERFDPVADTEEIIACHELYAAGHPVDDPENLSLSGRGPGLLDECTSNVSIR